MSRNCPFCNSQAIFLYDLKDYNRKITNKEFTYNKCKICRSIFIENKPANLGEYYGESYYAIPSKEKLKKISKKNSYKVELISKYAMGKKYLEIGPAFGVLASAVNDAGFKVDAIEMSPECCQYLKDGICDNVYESDDPLLTLNQLDNYDVIVLWHVIEHLDEVKKLIESVVSKLNKNGVLVIAAPNPESSQLRIMGKKWPHIDAPRHLILMPIETIVNFTESINSELVYSSTNDRDAFLWNFFGWQRLLLNEGGDSKAYKILAYLIGTAISLIMAPLEYIGKNGSAYTLIFRKK